jgi:ferredoxin-NADP reductase
MVKKEARQSRCDVVLVYAIRHPACGACREKGFELAQLAKADPKLRIVTAVKETGSVDKALLEYYQTYGGRNPIYKDEHRGIYHAMGGQRSGGVQIRRKC